MAARGAQAFVRADRESEVLRQVEAPRPSDLPEPDQYQLPEMGSVDLSYAGRLADASQTLIAIAEAEVDNSVTLERREGKWLPTGNGRLADQSERSPANGTIPWHHK